MSEMIAGFRLSPQQKRLWSLEEGAASYMARDLVRLTGPLDPEALKAALRQVVARHEIFRTTFRRRSGIRFPILVVADEPAFAWSVENLSAFDTAARERRIEELFRTAGEPFDLAVGPVLRAVLIRFSAHDHLLLLTLPSLCADAGTLRNLTRELGVAYREPAGFADGEPLQYVQFSEWQHGLLEEEDGQAAIESWRQSRASWLAGPALPFERRADAVESFQPETAAAVLPAASVLAIEAFARSQDSSVELFLLTCWQILLARLTEREELTVGVVSEGRKFAELSETMGLLSKALPVRVHVGAGHRFREVCAETGAAVEAAREVMEYFAWDDGDVTVAAPIPAAGFEYDESPAEWTAAALSWRLERRRIDLDRFKVRLAAFRHEQDLRLEVSSDAAFVARVDADRLVGHLMCLIESALIDPEALVGDLEILAPAERRRLLVNLNENGFTAPAERCVHALFEAAAAGGAERTAVVFESSALNYGELEARANRLAHWLQKAGVGPDDRVGLCLNRSLDVVVSLLGVLKAGGAYVPLDPGLPGERLAFLLRESGCRVVVSHGSLLERLPPEAAPAVLCLDGDPDPLAGEDGRPPVCPATPSNLAYVIFTSGSTGQPKGVAVEHRQLFHYIHAVRAALDLPDGASYAMVSTFAADLGNTSLFPALCFGGCLHVISEERSTDPYRLEEYLAHHPIDCLKIVPSHLAVLERFVKPSLLLPRQRLILGGEASRIDWVEKLLRAEPPPACEVFNHYGPTETTVGVLAFRAGARTLDGRGGATLPLGRPLGASRIYLLNGAQQPVPAGIPGELFVGGPGVSRGYLGRPGLTAERFLPDGFGPLPGGRLYRTGDLARYLPSGDVEFLGRVDLQVKVRGFRIELGEIESALLRHPAVGEAVVVAQHADVTTRLVAYLTTGAVAKPKIEDLRTFLGGLLPEYMIPAFFITLDRLPLTPNGKVDRAALPAPDTVRPNLDRDYVAPATPVEEMLAMIWAEVLGLMRVGVSDKFFALGGDSLHSVRMLALVKERGFEISLQDLFQHQTIAELARRLESAGTASGTVVRSEPFSLISAEDRRRVPAGIVDAYPLTSLQQAMFFHMLENPESPAYHNIYSFHLRAAYDLGVLREAVQEAVARYAMLRTSFHMTGFSQPLQLVHESALLEIGAGDLRHLAFAEQEEELRGFVAAEKRRPFDFRQPPLWRMYFHRRTDDTFQFTMTECHPISDGWSTNATLAEIFESYAALLKGRTPPEKPPVAVSYRDFVLLEGEALASEETAGYWAGKLADATVTRLPGRSEKLADGPPSIRRLNFPLDPALYEGLRRFAQEAEVPVKSVALAAHMRVLGVLSGQSEALTALLVDGRPEEAGGDQLRGLCLNTVPFRLDAGGGSWRDLARQTFLAERELYPHRRYPLSELQQRWGTVPLLDTFFAYLHFRTLGVIARSEDVEVLNYGNTTVSETTFTLCTYLWVDPVPSQSALILTRDERVLDEAGIRLIYGYYKRALEAMAADPAAPYRHLSLLDAAEEDQVTRRWNGTGAAYPQGTFPELFAAQAARAPERIAARAGGDAVTYGELAIQTDRLARSLVARGAGPEAAVALFFDRGLPLLAAIVGTLKAGAAYLPLDPHHPVERIRQTLELSGVQLVVASAELMERVREAAAALPEGTRPRLVAFDEVVAEGGAAGEALPGIHPESLAYVIFTSGSTGVPKGAMLEHRGMVNHLFVKIDTLGLTARDVVAQTASQCFDISVWQLLAALLAGGRIEIFEDELTHDPLRLLAALDRSGVTVFETVPSMLGAMLGENASPAAPLLKDLRWMVVTGEALPPDLCARWLSRFPMIPVVNAYGPTECSDDVTQHLIAAAPEAGEVSVPIGRALPNLRIYVVDRWLHPVPEGVAGELCVGGVGVGRGYLGQPAGTARVFVPDPFSPKGGSRLYRTGDLARLRPDGAFLFLGRIDHQVKVRGFRIELGEVEAVLAQNPAVSQAVATIWTEAGKEPYLAAYWVPKGDLAPTTAELRAFLKSRLPDYMIPAALVALPELPLTPNGKVDRAALPAPSPELSAESPSQDAPHSVTEDLLSVIWARLLNVERVGRGDSFFDLGGHSLLAAQLVFRVREAFGIDLPMATLFTHPELGEFAAVVDEVRKAGQGLEAPPLAQAPRGETLPQSLAQQRLWLVDRMNRGSLGYNLRQACRLRGPLDRTALAHSFTELIRRHETLRTSFSSVDEQPVQIIHSACEVKLPVLDLRGLPEAERKSEIRRQANLETQTRFDLMQVPLLQVKLLWLASDEHVLLFTLHHIVGDAWSLHVIVRELAALYEAFALGEPSPLPEPDFQYVDYAVWQREWLQGKGLAALLDYWRERLAGAPPFLNLRTDRPRPKEQTFRGAGYSLFLSRELADSLEALSRREEVTLFMALLAAFKVVLRHYSRQEDIVVGADVAGRDRAETEGMIGFFVNELVLRTDLSGAVTFSELLSRVREVCLGAYLHQDLPFMTLVEELRTERNLSYMPLFQVAFNLEYIPAAEAQSGPLRIEPLDLSDHQWARMDITLNVARTEYGLECWALYDADLFDRSTIARMLDTYRALLERLASQSDSRLDELEELVASQDRAHRENEERRFAEAGQQKWARLRRRDIIQEAERSGSR